MKKFGIDISKWQGDFDFESALNEGISFAIIKGGGSDKGLYTDSKYERNYLAAKHLNIPVGVYWYSAATSEKDAINEVEYLFSNVLKDKTFELPIFIDVEDEKMLSLGKEKLTEVVDAWCSALEKKNFWVGIYASVHTFNKQMNDDILKKYTHWVAQWAKECTYKNKDILGLWQFGGDTNLLRSNTVAGVVCDQNYMYLDFPELIKKVNKNGFTKKTPEKSVDQLAQEVINGNWGNGETRKQKLTEMGYDYNAVQKRVNELCEPAKPAVRAGDLVKMKKNAPIYNTDKPFAPFVYTNLLYLRELKGNRAVISLEPYGPVTGAVDVKYLTKYKT